MKVRGLSSLTLTVRLLCKINGLFATFIRPHLTPAELVAYNALVAACSTFVDLFPLTVE